MPVCDCLIWKNASYYTNMVSLLYGSFNVCAILTKLSMWHWTKSFLSKERSLIGTRIEPRLFLHDISHKLTGNSFYRCRQKGESFPFWRVLTKSHGYIAADQFSSTTFNVKSLETWDLHTGTKSGINTTHSASDGVGSGLILMSNKENRTVIGLTYWSTSPQTPSMGWKHKK
jgi:hypothetical protein